MTFNYTIDNLKKLVVLRAEGKVTEKEWDQLFTGIKNDPSREELMDYLFDMRDNSAVISDSYLLNISQYLRSIIPDRGRVKWAFICNREKVMQLIDRFALYLIKSDAIEVKRFRNMTDALFWINEDRAERFTDISS